MELVAVYIWIFFFVLKIKFQQFPNSELCLLIGKMSFVNNKA